LTHIFSRTVFNIFATKKHRKPKFSMLFGAVGRIRTADLILANGIGDWGLPCRDLCRLHNSLYKDKKSLAVRKDDDS